MPEIEVDDEVYEVLERRAVPFVDTTPNKVLRRLLDLDGNPTTPGTAKSDGPASRANNASRESATGVGSPRRRQRLPTGVLLPESEYRAPILEFLLEKGGAAPAGDVIDAVGERLRDRFTEHDYEDLSSGGIRWRKRAQFVRLQLVEEGLLARDTWGTWALTEAGRRAARRR